MGIDNDTDSPGASGAAGDHPEQAESALKLLQSLAAAAGSPENLERAFLDWAQLSDEATTSPEFGAILSGILSARGREEGAPSAGMPPAVAGARSLNDQDIFFLDANGVVVDVGAELSNILNIKVGDSLEPAYFQALFEEDQSSPSGAAGRQSQTIELRDRFNIKRRIVLHRTGDEATSRKYAALYIRVSLSPDARAELQAQHGLTKSELEILELAVQRYSPEQIAELRKSKLNTVRTHISRLIQKMECKSLNEAIGSAIELTIAKTAHPAAFLSSPVAKEHSIRKVTIPDQDAVVAYRRYGPLSGRPVVILHSLEYGYQPTPEFLQSARARGLCLYFALRPGFGETTSAVNLEKGAAIIGGFLKAVDISGAAIIALSTSAPMALAIQNAHDRIEQIVLVNYGLNADGKTDLIEPKWIRGMIKMALSSPSSFAAGLETVRTFFRSFGTHRFYRMLYSGVEADAKFMEAHAELFRQSGEHMIRANRLNIRLDFMSSFMPNRDLVHHIANHKRVTVVNGANQHMVSPDEAIENARSLGVTLEVVSEGGRNWPFVYPDKLFDVIDRSDKEAAGTEAPAD